MPRGGLALSVGVVLADSSIVTLALPEILARLRRHGRRRLLGPDRLQPRARAGDPAGRRGSRGSRPRAGWARGTGGLRRLPRRPARAADSEAALIAARVVQAVGGALTIACAIELLARLRGSHELAAPLWGTAGTIGVAVGPAVGRPADGAVQLAVDLPRPAAAAAARPGRPRRALRQPERGREGPLDLRPEVGLALLSAGLTGALFLLVILLTEGWGLSPLAAAATVSVIPAAAYAARWLAQRAGPPASAALAGGHRRRRRPGARSRSFPAPRSALTLQPQLLIGIGLALALPVLTLAAVGGRDPAAPAPRRRSPLATPGSSSGSSPSRRSSPPSSIDSRVAAQDATTALILDAPLPPETKLDARDGARRRESRPPTGDCRTSGRRSPRSPRHPATRPRSTQLEADIVDQIERAATNAFSLPFLAAALRAPRPDPDRPGSQEVAMTNAGSER